MPLWLKIGLAVVAVGIVLLVAAGVVVVKTVEKGVKAADLARAEGEGWGETGSLAVCVEEGVRRTGSCESNAYQCIFEIDAFLWGCLESAPFETAFCAEVPAAGNDPATLAWSQQSCARHGLPEHEQCAFNLSVVPAFCSSRG